MLSSLQRSFAALLAAEPLALCHAAWLPDIKTTGNVQEYICHTCRSMCAIPSQHGEHVPRSHFYRRQHYRRGRCSQEEEQTEEEGEWRKMNMPASERMMVTMGAIGTALGFRMGKR